MSLENKQPKEPAPNAFGLIDIQVKNIYGAYSQRPRLEMIVGKELVLRLEPQEARQLALNLLSSVGACLQEKFLAFLLFEGFPQTEEEKIKFGQMLGAYRHFRASDESIYGPEDT